MAIAATAIAARGSRPAVGAHRRQRVRDLADGAPRVAAVIAPCTSTNVANVATNGGTRRSTTRPALTAPTARPASSARMIATGSAPARPSVCEATITVVRPITAPIDRSMPPTSSTSVWPTAVMPIRPASKRIRRRLSVPNTPGAVAAASTTTAASPASGAARVARRCGAARAVIRRRTPSPARRRASPSSPARRSTPTRRRHVRG